MTATRAAAIVIVLLIATGRPALAAPFFLVGTWYGEGQPSSENVTWVVQFKSDGHWAARFRYCTTPRHESATSGTWTADKHAWTLVYTFSNGQPMYWEDRYVTLSYDGRKHTYRSTQTGHTFTAVRVPDGSKPPACEIVG